MYALVKSCDLPCRAGLSSLSLVSTNASACSRHASPNFSSCSANQVASMGSVRWAWATPSASFSRPSCSNRSANSLYRPAWRYSLSTSSSLACSACFSFTTKSTTLRLRHVLEESCPGLISSRTHASTLFRSRAVAFPAIAPATSTPIPP